MSQYKEMPMIFVVSLFLEESHPIIVVVVVGVHQQFTIENSIFAAKTKKKFTHEGDASARARASAPTRKNLT